MTNDDRLATLLTDALERDAEGAPEMPLRPRWTVDAAPVNAAGTPRSTAAVAIATGARGPRRQRGVVAAMGLVAGLAFVIGGLVVLQRDGSAPPTADVPTSGTRADAPPVPAPGGMMVLDELPDALAGAEVSGSAGSTPIVDPTSIAGIWVHRWYTATMDRPELEPHLMVASYRADEPLGQLTDGEVHEAVVQGVPAELYDDPFSGGRAVSFHDGATMFVLTGFHLTDDELLRAAEHTVVASGRPGAVVDPAFLPPGLVERASGTQFERHFLPLESLREPSPMIRWDVEDAMVWIQTVTEPADLAPLHRLGYGDVTDTTVRGRPAFLTDLVRRVGHLSAGQQRCRGRLGARHRRAPSSRYRCRVGRAASGHRSTRVRARRPRAGGSRVDQCASARRRTRRIHGRGRVRCRHVGVRDRRRRLGLQDRRRPRHDGRGAGCAQRLGGRGAPPDLPRRRDPRDTTLTRRGNGTVPRVRVRGGARVGRWVTSLVVVAVLAGCADDAVSPATGEGALLATPFQTLAHAAAGDVAMVFRVVAEREFGDGDVTPRHDGAPPASPAPDPSGAEYVGRVVRVLVDEVVWTSGDREVPTELELVTPG